MAEAPVQAAILHIGSSVGFRVTLDTLALGQEESGSNQQPFDRIREVVRVR